MAYQFFMGELMPKSSLWWQASSCLSSWYFFENERNSATGD